MIALTPEHVVDILRLSRRMPTTHALSLPRLYLMRLLFLLNFAMLGAQVWPVLLNHPEPWVR